MVFWFKKNICTTTEMLEKFYILRAFLPAAFDAYQQPVLINLF
jgi:hypothetical protein